MKQYLFPDLRFVSRWLSATLILLVLLAGCSPAPETASQNPTIAPPEELYGPLFYAIQSSEIRMFSDSKLFCDAIPKTTVTTIRENFEKLANKADTSVLKKFVLDHFELPSYSAVFHSETNIHSHINQLWNVLTRQPESPKSGTLIPLPNAYIVPGGRFREVYYWDSYFTMLGLQSAGKTELMQNIVDNFSYLIQTYGFIPNGNRTYYLSRSQPPFYVFMVSLLAESQKSDSVYLKYQPFITKEYAFWMRGESQITAKNPENKRVVRMQDGLVLNRYWDELESPRQESYRKDVKTAREATQRLGRNEKDVYRNLRAGAESGWDFSSRWLKDENIASIQTTNIIPVDLNALLYHMELVLAKCARMKGAPDSAIYYQNRAAKRKEAINRFCWNEKAGYFMDYHFIEQKQTTVISLAGLYPLFVRMAEPMQAKRTAYFAQNNFLKSGGFVTTTLSTHQQWDSPNGWAPLQWIGIQGLRAYSLNSLADLVADRWLRVNQNVFSQTHKMMEKYNVADTTNARKGGGGEYPNQDGFGWTNGVFAALSEKHSHK